MPTPSLESIRLAHRRDYAAEIRLLTGELKRVRHNHQWELDPVARRRLLKQIRRLHLRRSVLLDQLEARAAETRAACTSTKRPKSSARESGGSFSSATTRFLRKRI